MKKLFHIVVLGILMTPLIIFSAQGQSGHSGWQLSLGGGFMNYYGDVSPYRIHHWKDWKQAFKFFQFNKHYIPEASFGISLEKRFTPGVGLMIQANKGVLEMSDRYRRPNGDYDMDALHWDRALNFKTDIYDAGLAVTFHSDNGKLLRRNAFFSPYLFLGAGVTYFKVKGDLYDADGNPYDYADPDVHPDGKFETNLRDLKTERDKKYNNITPYADLGVGVKFRLSKGVSITVQTDVHYSFSDYLDDVSGTYKSEYSSAEQAYAARPGTNVSTDNKRGYDDGVNDFYIFNKAAIQFNLGGGHKFKAPVIYQPSRKKGILLESLQQEEPKNENEINNHAEDSTNISEEKIAAKNSTKKTLKDSVENRSVTTDSIAGEIYQLRNMLRRSRFDHIDQAYIIKENKVKYEIADQKKKVQSLKMNRPLSEQDSLQLEKGKSKLKDLYLERRAIREAREQLRRRYANTPIVTEYADSTKIMIYRNHSPLQKDTISAYGKKFGEVEGNPAIHYDTVENSVNKRRLDTTTSQLQNTDTLQTTDSTGKLSQQEETFTSERDSLERGYQRKIDSLKQINDSLRLRSSSTDTLKQAPNASVGNDRGFEQDSLQSAYDSLLAQYRRDSAQKDSQRVLVEQRLQQNRTQMKSDSLTRAHLQKRIDSILNQSKADSMARRRQEQSLGDSLQQKNQRIQQDSLRSHQLKNKVDSLLTLYKKDSVNAQKQARLLQNKQRTNNKQLERDSLQRLRLQRRVDSLQQVQIATLRKMDTQDSVNRTFFQRIFTSPKKKKSNSRKNQDSVRRLQRQLSSEKEAIHRLNDNIEDLKKQNDRYNDKLHDLNDDRGLQGAYLRAAIDQMNRRGYDYGRSAPSLSAPIVVPTGGRGSKNYDSQLEEIRRRLDSLQTVKEDISTLETQQSDSLNQRRALSDSAEERMNDIHAQLDALKQMDASEREGKKEYLKQQVDSLNQTIDRLKKEGTAEKESEIDGVISHFPVISTYFATGSSSLDRKGISDLRAAAAMVKKYPDIAISLKGFTDGTGSEHANEVVARRRVQAVKEALISKYNIETSHIQIEPVTKSNSQKGSNPLDRRVDVTLKKK